MCVVLDGAPGAATWRRELLFNRNPIMLWGTLTRSFRNLRNRQFDVASETPWNDFGRENPMRIILVDDDPEEIYHIIRLLRNPKPQMIVLMKHHSVTEPRIDHTIQRAA